MILLIYSFMGMHMHRCTRMLTFAVLTMSAVMTPAVAETQPSRVLFDWNKVLTDPAEIVDQQTEQRQQLEARLAQAAEPMDKAQAQLALANWWLSVTTARPATRWLIGVQTAADGKTMADATGKAASLIESARTTLAKPAAKGDTDEAKKTRPRLEQSADALAAFVDVFQLADRDTATEPSREAWRKAGRGLALARESDDAELAAAARLWQSFALAQAGKRERALDTLPDSLAKPAHLPYDLMSRLLRCRLLAESGQYAAATALLSRMETILKTWVPSQDRNSARRLIAFVQYRVVRDWIDKQRSTTRPAAAASLDSILAGIDSDFADLKSPTIYYMATSVPVKVAIPEGKSRNSASTQKSSSDK